MKNDLLLKYDWVLKWKDVSVLEFNITRNIVKILKRDYLPLSLKNVEVNVDRVVKFCTDRLLMSERKYHDDIINSINADDYSPTVLCLCVNGLSYTDNYWFCKKRHNIKWKNINLYDNEVSKALALTALIGDKIEYDKLLTGEITLKGTKAKCVVRNSDNLYLYKNENDSEIKAELLASYVAKALKLESAEYKQMELYKRKCSVCQLLTDKNYELISYREIISYKSKQSYDYVMGIDAYNFCLMQIFDYLTLNTDRNRDNFGLLRANGEIISLFPIFDFDACFSGKSDNAYYFPSEKSFRITLSYLKSLTIYHQIDISQIRKEVIKLRGIFEEYDSLGWYKDMCDRLNSL